MAEHTPGPWRATRTNWMGDPVEHNFYVHGNEHKDRVGSYATGVAIVCGNATSRGVTDANARLIAASPALLNVVTRYRAYHDQILWPAARPCRCEVCLQADEIINAVKGQP